VDSTDTATKRRDRAIDFSLWILTGLFATTTIWFSFVAPPPGVNLFPGADKVQHGIAYFATTLSFLFAAVWRPGRGDGPFPRLSRWIFAAVVIVGIVVEAIQEQTPARTAELADVAAEAIGAGAAIAIHAGIRRWSRSRPPSPNGS